ncbi:MAG: PASTA domain-containing protein [Leptospiraceae bacterium]|nr:PASTA domain-containing protein [Leptospiraceae bacterium]MCB1304317.1 PASTA domain-containing protein [Leptospiraceae bacterium]
MQYLKNLLQTLFPVFVAAAVFVVIAVMVLLIRSEDPDSFALQDYRGQYYINVHNDLERRRLRVKLEKRNFPDRPEGIILDQDVRPGTIVEPRQNIRFVVNQHQPLLQVPDLVGTGKAGIAAALERIVVGDQVYSLRPGTIAYVFDDGVPEGTILAQSPLAGEKVDPGFPVDFLVSTSVPYRGKTVNPAELKDMPIDLAYELLLRTGATFEIEKILSPERPSQQGRVASVKPLGGDRFSLQVYYQKPSASFASGYEQAEVEIPEQYRDKEMCSLYHYPENDPQSRKAIFRQKLSSEKETVVFFRRKTEILELRCGATVVSRQTLSPDFSG